MTHILIHKSGSAEHAREGDEFSNALIGLAKSFDGRIDMKERFRKESISRIF